MFCGLFDFALAGVRLICIFSLNLFDCLIIDVKNIQNVPTRQNSEKP
jgi:hypothetical protein